jgi:hypothetical protein
MLRALQRTVLFSDFMRARSEDLSTMGFPRPAMAAGRARAIDGW